MGRLAPLFAGVALLVATAGFGGVVRAQQSAKTSSPESKAASQNGRSPGEVSNIVDELSQEIYSPYCPGKTLAMCPSGGAAEVRRNIQQMARNGVPKPEIKQRILEKHGEEFRLKEPPKEDNYPLIAMIAVGLLLCAGTVYAFVRSGDSESDSDDSDSDDWSEEDEIYLSELRSYYRE